MAGFEDIWEDEPEPVNKWLLRSVPLYPDPDPEGTARMFENLRAYQAERRALADTSADDEEYEVTITQPAEEFDDPCSPLARYVSLLHKSGWNLHMLGHSKAFAKGKPFKSGANEGKPRPDQDIETQWVYAEKPGVGRVNVSYTLVNGVVRGNMTTYRMNGHRFGDRELKARIKGG